MRLDALTLVRWASALMAVILAAAFGWRAATWAWRAMTPASAVAVPGLRAEVNPAKIAERAWFGAVAAAIQAPPAAASAASGLRLVGIVAGGTRPAAIVGAGGTAPKAFIQGETITDGITLQTVAVDHVVVLRSGVAERLELPAKPPITLQVQRKESSK